MNTKIDFISGISGSGKSFYILNDIIEKAYSKGEHFTFIGTDKPNTNLGFSKIELANKIPDTIFNLGFVNGEKDIKGIEYLAHFFTLSITENRYIRGFSINKIYNVFYNSLIDFYDEGYYSKDSFYTIKGVLSNFDRFLENCSLHDQSISSRLTHFKDNIASTNSLEYIFDGNDVLPTEVSLEENLFITSDSIWTHINSCKMFYVLQLLSKASKIKNKTTLIIDLGYVDFYQELINYILDLNNNFKSFDKIIFTSQNLEKLIYNKKITTNLNEIILFKQIKTDLILNEDMKISKELYEKSLKLERGEYIKIKN